MVGKNYDNLRFEKGDKLSIKLDIFSLQYYIGAV